MAFSKTIMLLTVLTAASTTVFAQDSKPSDAGAAGFDLSLPVTIERCKMTDELNNYMDTIKSDDIASYKKIELFLVSCRDLIDNNIKANQEELKSLEANPPKTK